MPAFNWEPTILTVHEKYYEEAPDWNLVKLLPQNLRIEKVKAFKTTKPRLIGDIGLRAFFQLYKKAKQLIKQEGFDFLYIPIPSFYCALLGRWLHSSTGIKYGIDYIDPWVHQFPGSNKVFTRHWLSTQVAKFLEPIAVKKASLITGVAPGYFDAVLERNPHLKQQALTGAMPYGAEANDHSIVSQLQNIHYLFTKNNKIQLVYAGAMLPKAYAPLRAIFAAIRQQLSLFQNIEFHFIGTGSRVDDDKSFNIKTHAEEFGLWQQVVFEYPKRIPYLEVLAHLNIADGIFILGSTEPHYTPSKTYQGVLSKKPILAILHSESSAVTVLRDSGAGIVLDFDGENDLASINQKFMDSWNMFSAFQNNYSTGNITYDLFEKYSARETTRTLASLLDRVIKK